MSFENKYRVHEVAKDFGKQTKDITQILTTYATAPKNHMQVLSDKELSIVFEYMTQHNQVADMQASLATAPKGGENRGRNDRNDRGQQNRQGGQNQHNNQAPKSGSQNNQQAQQPANRPTSRVPEKKLVDTRKGGQVNLEKYDERLENLAAGKTKQMQAGKQKFRAATSARAASRAASAARRSRRRCAACAWRSSRRPR